MGTRRITTPAAAAVMACSPLVGGGTSGGDNAANTASCRLYVHK
jgi:hypothetical protein